jgi:hypothetical protein
MKSKATASAVERTDGAKTPVQTDDADAQAVQRTAGGKTPASTDDADKAVAVPPDVLKLVNQYRGYQRRTAEAYIGLAETVWTASETLSKEKLRRFCDEVGLEFDGDHYKAHVKVGQHAPRFKAVIDKVPDKPTTIDWLARISPNQFQIVEPHLKPDSKMRELRALLPGDSTKKRAKRKKTSTVTIRSTSWLLETAGPMDDRTKSEVQEELTKVSDRFGLAMKLIEPSASTLPQ